jgi:hypothetical protein
MKNFSICAGIAVLSFAFAPAQQTVAANAQGPRFLVIDRHAIMAESKLGENIRQQVMGYEEKLQNDLGPEGQAIKKEIKM